MIITKEHIKMYYDELQQKNYNEFDLKRNLIYTNHPDVRDSYYKLLDLKLERFKIQNSFDNKNELSVTENKIIEEQKIFDELLSKYSINKKDLEIKYSCEKCKDTGYIDGKECECYKKIEVEILKKQNFSKINKYFDTDNFNKLNLKLYNQNLTSIENTPYNEYMAAKISELVEDIKNIKNKAAFYYIFGGIGTGKTFLGHAIACESFAQNLSTLFVSSTDLTKSFFSFDNDNDYEDYIDDIIYYSKFAKVLIVDDLGRENYSDYSINKIYELLEARLNSNLSTFILSNLSLNDFKRTYSDTIMSRVYSNFKFIKLDGKDLRTSFKGV